MEEIYWWLHLVDEATQRRVVRALAERYDIDTAADCSKYVMDWDEIRTMAADPLLTIGGHTKGHFASRSILLTDSVSSSRRSSRHRLSSGLPVSTPDRFSLRLVATSELLGLH